jgi:cytochrome c oxidase assembly protein subunit 15
MGAVAWQLRGGPLHTHAKWIAALAAWQFASGLSNVVLDWPLVAAVAHTGGAAALVVVLTWTLLVGRVRVRDPGAAAGAAGVRLRAQPGLRKRGTQP